MGAPLRRYGDAVSHQHMLACCHPSALHGLTRRGSSSTTSMACTRPAAQSTLTLARVVRCAPADADNGVHGQADLRAPLTRISHRSAARMHSFPDTPGVHAM